MRRGCIAISEVVCNGCGRTIEHGERYLASEADSGITERLCQDCCFKKGFAGYQKERGQEYLTLFADAFTDAK
jgi:hypothetical protein